MILTVYDIHEAEESIRWTARLLQLTASIGKKVDMSDTICSANEVNIAMDCIDKL